MNAKERKRLYLIGIDAAPKWLLDELSKEKGMEAFSELLKKKAIVDLESTLPPMTGAAWPTIYTGLNPSEHGVPDFFVMKSDYTPDLAYYDSDEVPPFWKKLAQKGHKCLIITPATDIKLPKYKNIDMITGFPLPAKTNSEYLRDLMDKYDFHGEPEIEKDMKAGKMSDDEAVIHFSKSIKARSSIAKDAISKSSYDFIYICFTETDRLQHFVLNKENREKYLLPIYSGINEFVSFAKKDIEENGGSIVIVSDHGSQPIKEKFLLNAWLVKNRYLFLNDSIMKNTASGKKAGISYKLREKVLKTGLRNVYDKMPHAAKSAVSKSMRALFSTSASDKYTRLHLFDYDMSKSRVFAGISNLDVATLWINDQRFDKGIVENVQKEKLKEEVISKLKEVKDSSGNKMFVNIFDGDEYYKNTKKFISPDILAEARAGYSIDIFNFSTSTLFMEPEPPKRGDHTRYGIFGFYSKSYKTSINNIKITEVSGTILRYFGLK